MWSAHSCSLPLKLPLFLILNLKSVVQGGRFLDFHASVYLP
jgi:hypothetical protein